MQAMSLAQGQRQLDKLHRQVIHDFEPVILTHDEGSVVLISLDEWNGWRETMRLLQDKKAMRALLESFDEHDNGVKNGFSIEELFTDLQ